jgi:16S rRNA G527 N7-methylase RsmG
MMARRVSEATATQDLWNALAARVGATLGPAQHDLMRRYLDLLLAANARMNLTRITDRPAAELHHVADALTLLPHLPTTPACRASS